MFISLVKRVKKTDLVRNWFTFQFEPLTTIYNIFSRTYHLGEGFTKKSSCSFGFCSLFTNCIYWVNLGLGREGETPTKFFGTLAFKKEAVQVVQIRGRAGGRGNLDKIQKNSYFFSWNLPIVDFVRPRLVIGNDSLPTHVISIQYTGYMQYAAIYLRRKIFGWNS